METLITTFVLPALLPLVVVLLIFILIFFLLKQAKLSWQKKYREPFYSELLRPPGWGCIKRREEAMFDIAAIVVSLPALWGCVTMLALHGAKVSAIGVGLVATITSIMLARKLSQRVKDARTAYMGYFGEWAVAENLEPLTMSGWRIFHDFVMHGTDEPYNIDHIAVGPAGVFAIETKARSKPTDQPQGSNELHVDYDNVCFPDGRREKPLKQAKGNALALRDWLQAKGVEINYVNPVVVLPGWTVKYKSKANREIRDPRNLAAYILKQSSQANSATIEKAAAEIDQHCRSLKFSDVGF